MQRKNFHFGRAQYVKYPAIYSMEAFLLWDNLVSRYDIIHVTQLYLNAIHDVDFKLIMKKGLMAILEKQVNILEQKMDLYHLPLPDRPPKSVKFFLTGNVVNDEYVYHKLFKGIQNSIDGLVKSVVSFVYNDDLRRLFFEYLQKELEVYDDLCKYGKLKGWMRNPPLIPANGG